MSVQPKKLPQPPLDAVSNAGIPNSFPDYQAESSPTNFVRKYPNFKVLRLARRPSPHHDHKLMGLEYPIPLVEFI